MCFLFVPAEDKLPQKGCSLSAASNPISARANEDYLAHFKKKLRDVLAKESGLTRQKWCFYTCRVVGRRRHACLLMLTMGSCSQKLLALWKVEQKKWGHYGHVIPSQSLSNSPCF